MGRVSKIAKPSDDWLEVEREVRRQDIEGDPAEPIRRSARSTKAVTKIDEHGVPAQSSIDRIVAEFRDAAPGATSPIDYIEELDRRLVLAGMPETSEWWKQTMRRFYSSTCLQMVLRVGRRGGKSSTLCRIAVLEALLGDHRVARGDTAVVALISKDRDDAKERLNTIREILDVLYVKYKATAGRIDLADRDLAFRVYTASVAGVSGFSGICVICDEVSKWMDKEAGANPATEVLSSVRPTMAGLPNARIFLSSSPWGKWDAHAKAFDAGESSHQQVAFAETWVARPALTLEGTRRLEPDERKWMREFAAVPMEGEEDSLFPPSMISLCTRRVGAIGREPGVEYVAAMAPALAHDAWSIVIAAKGNGQHIVSLAECRGAVEPAKVLPDVKAMLAEYGLTSILSTREGLAHVEAAYKLGIHVRVATTPLVDLANAMLTRLSRGEDDLPPDPDLRADLLALQRADSETPGEFSVRLADVERFPSYAVPTMIALFEASRLPEPKKAVQKTEEERLLSDLVRRNRLEYPGEGDDAA